MTTPGGEEVAEQIVREYVGHPKAHTGLIAAISALQAEIARLTADNVRLVAACNGAIEWLEGWASAEPYLTILREAAHPKEKS
jgi:hypothetical protein